MKVFALSAKWIHLVVFYNKGFPTALLGYCKAGHENKSHAKVGTQVILCPHAVMPLVQLSQATFQWLGKDVLNQQPQKKVEIVIKRENNTCKKVPLSMPQSEVTEKPKHLKTKCMTEATSKVFCDPSCETFIRSEKRGKVSFTAIDHQLLDHGFNEIELVEQNTIATNEKVDKTTNQKSCLHKIVVGTARNQVLMMQKEQNQVSMLHLQESLWQPCILCKGNNQSSCDHFSHKTWLELCCSPF